MIDAPCKDCEKRRIGCHSNCSLYLRFVDENQRAKRKRYDESEAEQLSYELHRTRTKTKKRRS